jgi:hypothetical protein
MEKGIVKPNRLLSDCKYEKFREKHNKSLKQYKIRTAYFVLLKSKKSIQIQKNEVRILYCFKYSL